MKCLVISIAIGLGIVAQAGTARASTEVVSMEGRYRVGDVGDVVTVRPDADGLLHLVGTSGLKGVGFFDAPFYWGVFRYPDGTGGTHHGELQRDGTVKMNGEFTVKRAGTFEVTWTPLPDSARLRPPAQPDAEVLPVAITKVPPAYPDEAREKKVQGLVIVEALVGKDGRVEDTRMLKSIPLLDAAAMAAVRQWTFKPATYKGEPVRAWVSMPVKFTLH